MWVIYWLSQHQLFKKNLSLYCYLLYLFLNLNITVWYVTKFWLSSCRASGSHQWHSQVFWLPGWVITVTVQKRNYELEKESTIIYWIVLYLALKFKPRKSMVFISNVNFIATWAVLEVRHHLCCRRHYHPTPPAATPLVTYALDTSVFFEWC